MAYKGENRWAMTCEGEKRGQNGLKGGIERKDWIERRENGLWKGRRGEIGLKGITGERLDWEEREWLIWDRDNGRMIR